jgi:hypothetical protein
VDIEATLKGELWLVAAGQILGKIFEEGVYI